MGKTPSNAADRDRAAKLAQAIVAAQDPYDSDALFKAELELDQLCQAGADLRGAAAVLQPHIARFGGKTLELALQVLRATLPDRAAWNKTVYEKLAVLNGKGRDPRRAAAEFLCALLDRGLVMYPPAKEALATPEALAALGKALGDKDNVLRKLVAGAISGCVWTDADLAVILPQLAPALAGPSQEEVCKLLANAARHGLDIGPVLPALAKIRDKQPALIDAAIVVHHLLRGEVGEATACYTRSSQKSFLASETANFLTPSAHVPEFLVRLLDDQDKKIRRHALVGLGRLAFCGIDLGAVLPHVIALLTDSTPLPQDIPLGSYAAIALGWAALLAATRPQSLKALEDGLKGKEALRFRCARALASVYAREGDWRKVRALLESGDSEVRRAACSALEGAVTGQAPWGRPDAPKVDITPVKAELQRLARDALAEVSKAAKGALEWLKKEFGK
jgi:hypothetical protein